MALGDAESIALSIIAVVIIAAILLAIASTPAYPLAIGVEVVALVYVLMHGGAQLINNTSKFATSKIGA